MEDNMLEQIQQMITTANESLRHTLRQDMVALEFRLGERIDGVEQAQRGMEFRLSERIEGLELAQRGTESRLSDRIDDVKRHSGVLYEDLQHKLELVIEGQQFLRQDIGNVRSDIDTQTRETRTMIGAVYTQLNNRIDRHEQGHNT